MGVAATFHKKWRREFDSEFKDANPLQCGDLKNNKSEEEKKKKGEKQKEFI